MVVHDVKDIKPWHVYVLIDPRDQTVRYVGCTAHVDRRVKMHVSEAFSPEGFQRLKSVWVRGLAAEGLLPVLEVIESGFGRGWRETEKRWIHTKRFHGHPLTNGEEGFGHQRKPGERYKCVNCGGEFGWRRIDRDLHYFYLCPDLTIQEFMK